MMKKLLCMVLLFAGVLACTAHAASWQKLGTYRLSVLFFTAYDIALYAQSPRYDPAKPHALAIRYRMSFAADEIIDRSLKEIERNGKLPQAKRDRYRKHLTASISDVVEGDEIRADFFPGRETVFSKNGRIVHRITDGEFTRDFAAIWLADDTSEPAMRRSLIR